jgi:hypothetical protein
MTTQEELVLDFATGARNFVKRLSPSQTFKKQYLKDLCRSTIKEASTSDTPELFLNYTKGALLFVIGLQVNANQELTKDELLDLVELQYRKAQETYLSIL